MLKPVAIWGASGHARVLLEFLGESGYAPAAFFDNDPAARSPLEGVPLFHGEAGFKRWRDAAGAQPGACLAAIGGARGRDRVRLQALMADHGLQPLVAVHPRAFVARNARLGAGSQVLAHAVVAVEAELGEACIVNTSASVDHECRLGRGVHVAPGATLAGCVTVGDFCLIGPGAVVLPRVRIGDNAVVGAGAVVTRDLPGDCVAYGNPARVVRNNPG